ncbi:MAG: dihydropyrimidinase [Candidatus Aminicenantes bacterium]|nr:dihydropyrimidinase [Candidatus Aminicenantes bacterium]
MPRILIRGGTIVSEGRVFQGDILIAEERIVAVEKKIQATERLDRLIDAAGCEIFPGGVDPHVHMELQTPAGISSDDFASGSRAALAGGTTTILDFVTPGRGEPLPAALAARKAAAQKSLCDYGLHMSVTSLRRETADELALCRRQGIVSLKTYLAYKETIGLEDGDFLAVLDLARQLGMLVMVHAESGDMVAYLQKKFLAQGKTAVQFHPRSRPAELEGDAVQRAILMARLAGAPLYIVHISSRQGVEALAAARKAGQVVIGETCPQYLLLDENRYHQGDAGSAAYVMTPPLRGPEHQAALWEALATGIIQTLATDHCPFLLADKNRLAAVDFTRVPSGCGGCEYRLPLLYTFGVRSGKISLARFVELVSARPAKIFGLYPRKGVIRPGSDADLVIWDPEVKSTISAARQWQHCDHTVYQGLELQGGPRLVFGRGRAVFEEGNVHAEPGQGIYLPRGRSGDGS